MNYVVINYHPYVYTSFGLDLKKTHHHAHKINKSYIISWGGSKRGGKDSHIRKFHIVAWSTHTVSANGTSMLRTQYHPPSWTKFRPCKHMQSHCFDHVVFKKQEETCYVSDIWKSKEAKDQISASLHLPWAAVQCPRSQGWQRNPMIKPSEQWK